MASDTSAGCNPSGISPASSSSDVLDRLMAQLHQRAAELPEGSYTTKLIRGGVPKMGSKLLEESLEVVESAWESGPQGREHMVREACDVLYHLWVLLATKGINVEDLRKELERREGTSGIVEKQNRISGGAE
jgi:phosphoribosyl-ATP pyrophosphohydrolase